MKNVRKFYDCSMMHIPEDTAFALEGGAVAGVHVTMKNEYGFLVSVPEQLPDPRAAGDEIVAILALAIDAGCDYVLFDRDVPPVEYLREFDWN